MAESDEILMSTSEYTIVDPPEDSCEVSPTPTPTPRTPRQEAPGDCPLASASDQQVLLDQLYDEKEQACSYQEYEQVLKFCAEKERKDIATLQSLPQLMKNTLFFQNEDMLQSSQDRVKAKTGSDEEFKKFVKYLNTVLTSQQNHNQKAKATKLLETLNNAILIAENGKTSLKSSNKIFEKLYQVFKEATGFQGDPVGVSYVPLDLLREASDNNKQRQLCLQDGDLDAAEKCLSEAMERIEVSVGHAENQKDAAEKRYTEVACTNRHIAVQNLEREVQEALYNDKNGINLLTSHCCEDQQRIERAGVTLDRVYTKSQQHYIQLDDMQKRELDKNKQEQEQLEARLKELRESAKKIDLQRTHAKKQDKSAEKAYRESKKEVSDWQEQILRLQTQTQHADSVLGLVQETSEIVMQDFYQVHQLYLSELNTVAVESIQLYRQCLVGRIVACRFRNQELETNISSLQYMLTPKKEELKQHRKTGFKVMSDKIEKDVRELGEYKHIYMVAKQSIESVLVGAYEKLELVDAAIMKKVPDARLVPVEVIYESEREQRDATWDNLEMQSLTRALHWSVLNNTL